MKKTAVFIMPMLWGHLNMTVKMASVLEEMGYDVHFAGNKNLLRFTIKNRFKIFLLNTNPFTTNSQEINDASGFKKWFLKIKYRRSNEAFLARKNELERMMEQLKPSIVFLDEFYYSDFTSLYNYQNHCKICILQIKFGMYFDDLMPPPTVYKFPSSKSKHIWYKIFFIKRLKEFYNTILYFGYTKEALIKRTFELQKINKKYFINRQKIFTPSFKNVTEIFLHPYELDFYHKKPQAWQRYISPSFDNFSPTKEIIPAEIIVFLERKKERKLIYCSLGTLSTTHLKKDISKLQNFYETIIKLAEVNKNYFFIMSLGEDLKSKNDLIRNQENLLFINFVPQTFILNHSDVFYTAGGVPSIFDSVASKVPMLLFPLNNEWELNGSCARMVYHGLGLKSDLNENYEPIWQKTLDLLNNPAFKNAISKMSETLKEKYTHNYLVEQVSKLVEEKRFFY